MIQILFERLAALIGLLLLLPLLAIAGVLIWLEDRGPILFKQTRVGQHGRLFQILKLRTMRTEQEHRSQLTVGQDSRITKIGHFLRATKFDEFPQLLNVVCGDMSLVGPRPEVEKYVNLYTQSQRQVLSVKPGITDLASLVYYREAEMLATAKDPHNYYIQTIMPEKIRINLAYLKVKSFYADLQIIFYTLAKMFGVQISLDKFLKSNQNE